ncbi:MAG: flagellar biosynthesis protein FliQ [Clostridiales bacterium]|nr:flagellar biosynthesis protein FliQ [Clostridiales bacterium]
MSQGDLISLCKDAVSTALLISSPFLVVSLAIGIIISVFQAATQIHEQNVVFVPKIIATALILVLLGAWMMNIMINYTQNIFAHILQYI